MEFSLVFLAGTNLVQTELFDRLDRVVAGQEQREQFIRGGFFGDEQGLVLGVGLQGGCVNPNKTARFLLETKSGMRQKREDCVRLVI